MINRIVILSLILEKEDIFKLPTNQNKYLIYFLGGLTSYLFLEQLNDRFLKDKFITYDKFLQDYLEPNNIEKIEIVNTVLSGKQDS